MKKLIAFLCIIGGCAGCIWIFQQPAPPAHARASSVCLVVNGNVEIEDARVTALPSGNQTYLYMPVSLQSTFTSLPGICGYVYRYEGNTHWQALASKLMQYKLAAQQIGDSIVLCGYTPTYTDFRLVEGKRVNVQIAVQRDHVLVGYPLILTGF